MAKVPITETNASDDEHEEDINGRKYKMCAGYNTCVTWGNKITHPFILTYNPAVFNVPLGYQESFNQAVDQLRTEVSEVAEELKQRFNDIPEDLKQRFNRLQGQFFHAVRTINGANYMYRYR